MSNTRTTRAPARTPRARQSRPPAPTVTLLGTSYKVAEKIGVWPLMQFARAAEAGVSMADQKGLAAFHAQMQDVIHEDDWGRFQEDMITKKVSMEDLIDCAREAVEVVQAHMARKRGRANGAANGNGKVTAEIEG